PIASKLEEVCEAWIVTLLGLPETTAVGYVSGSSIATLCGLAAGREALASALEITGSYIVQSAHRDGMHYTPEMSRRARIVELWATLKSLRKTGVAELVEDLQQKAVHFAAELSKAGFSILNEVCFNQVLLAAENEKLTAAVLQKVQRSGELWCGGSQWQGQLVIRLSVCSFQTTHADIDRCVMAFANAREEALKA
ncbi:MAG: hypothetical protein SCK57_11360, partial [Bacillota bacterium]|nr:hypothetical protein [Bacillota bacterium]